MATTPLRSDRFAFLKRFLPKKKSVDRLQSFGERQESEMAYDPIDRGTSMVPLERITGSVGRYRDFDSKFRPKNHAPDERLTAIKERMKQGRSIPPISLYQIKDEYFIVDGHHRYTAAKDLGHAQIQANIMELLPTADTLENQLYMEKTAFRDKAALPTPVHLTELGQYPHLERQILEHQPALAAERKEDVSYQQAAADWYRTIYRPLATLITNSGLLASFSGRTVDDLYLYISVHQWEKGKARKYGIGVDKLIPKNMAVFRRKMAEHREQEYPEMRREITAFVLLNVDGKQEQRIFDKLVELAEVREVHSVHGSIDIVVKIVLTRDLLSSDAELLSQFLVSTIRQWRGVLATQTLIPGQAVIKEGNVDPDIP